MLYYLIATLFVINCLVLLLVILIQQGKAGDMASAFGGGGSSQAAFGARSGATLLTRVTWVSAGLFFIGALALSVVSSRGPGSVLGSVPLPAAPATQQAPAPATTPAPATPAPAQPQ
jgi:preprotein translocase subunit SecG